MKATNLIVADEEKFEKWLKERGIDFKKDNEIYKLAQKIDPRKAPGVWIANVGEKVDANKITDLTTKLASYPKFMEILQKLPMIVYCKDFAKYSALLQTRLTMGSLKYGSSWKYVDLLEELEQELLDITGYAYLEWLKRGRSIDLADERRLLTLGSTAIVLWNMVREMTHGKKV